MIVPVGTKDRCFGQFFFPLPRKSNFEFMKMSFFNAPIAPQKDAGGRILRPATLVPCAEVDVAQLHQYITTNEELYALTETVRAATDMREAKARLLPYVTPCGVFSYRNSISLMELSGLLPIDVDHLASYEEAVEIRQLLFDDPMLCPSLCFISPSRLGVKAFVPFTLPSEDVDDVPAYVSERLEWAMCYVATLFGNDLVDRSGKDLARSCFLCHDSGALLRLS